MEELIECSVQNIRSHPVMSPDLSETSSDPVATSQKTRKFGVAHRCWRRLSNGDVTHVPISCSMDGRTPAANGHSPEVRADPVRVCACVRARAYLEQADRESDGPRAATS